MRRALRRLRTRLRAAIGQDILVAPDVKVATTRFGTDYGGWDVADGLLQPSSVVYSFGVGEDASFDSELIDRYGVTVHAFDPTPRAIEWVKRQSLTDRFVLHEYGIADFDGDARFHPPDNPNYVSHSLVGGSTSGGQALSVPVKRLATIMAELGHDRLDLLKMDIEGAEYDVIRDIGASSIRPCQVLVEFHHRFPGVGVRKTVEALAALRTIGYRLFAVSSSNEEYCFIRADVVP